jgi:hypothetical protein
MGNLFSSESTTNPLSSNESTTPLDINQAITRLKKLIIRLQSDNSRYQNELVKKQDEVKKNLEKNKKDFAKISAQQVVRYNKMIKDNMTRIGQLNALIIKLQETKNTVELRKLVNQAKSDEVLIQNPLLKGGEYMEKLIKYEDKLLGLN